MEDKIAIISDIHGNALALEAVLEDLEKQNIRTVLNLGDSLYGPLDPAATFKLISHQVLISISGNQDRFILENEEYRYGSNTTLSFVLEALPDEAFAWLKKLEKEKTWRNIYMCHGNGEVDDSPLMEKFDKHELKQKSNAELEMELKNIEQHLILCGHTHVPKILRLSDSNKFIINPGSVGLPAYDDDLPFYHKMESDSPFAKYTIVEMEADEVVSVVQRHIKYDYHQAAKQAEKLGRSDWAGWLRTGKVPPE